MRESARANDRGRGMNDWSPPPNEISLSRKENENNLNAQQGQVAL
jgi:hypothetical protein